MPIPRPADRPHPRLRRRQGRRRLEHHRPQCRLVAVAQAHDRHGHHRSRPGLRHRRPQLQPGSAQGIAEALASPSVSTRRCSTGCLPSPASNLSLLSAPGLARPRLCNRRGGLRARCSTWCASAFPMWSSMCRNIWAPLDQGHARPGGRHRHHRHARSREPAQRQEPRRLCSIGAAQRPAAPLVLNQVGMPRRPEIPVEGFRRGARHRAAVGHSVRAAAVRHRRQQRPDDRRGRRQVEASRSWSRASPHDLDRARAPRRPSAASARSSPYQAVSGEKK